HRCRRLPRRRERTRRPRRRAGRELHRGMVAHTLDLLVESPLRICAEVSLPVRHCLLARAGATLATIKRVVAHPQALAQCRRWLGREPPNARTEQDATNAAPAEPAGNEPGT